MSGGPAVDRRDFLKWREPGTERPDRVAIELEFMHLLAMKESVARSEDAGDERFAACRDATALWQH